MVLLALDVICSTVSGAPDEDFVVLLRRFHPSSVMYVGISSVGAHGGSIKPIPMRFMPYEFVK